MSGVFLVFTRDDFARSEIMVSSAGRDMIPWVILSFHMKEFIMGSGRWTATVSDMECRSNFGSKESLMTSPCYHA